jgi:Zn-dependent protease
VEPLTIAGVATVAVVSITTHEASHGLVADRLGDPTARQAGRLTLNPIPHIDLFFTILLPLFLILSGSGVIFGGAKPVPVNVSRLRHPRRDWALVGAAGPLSNLALAIGLAGVFSGLLHAGLLDSRGAGAEVLVIGILINVLLALFNLIPIPPLDGSRLVQVVLSGPALAVWRRLERFGLLLVLALVFLVPSFQELLVTAIFACTEVIARLVGIWPQLQPVLTHALSG